VIVWFARSVQDFFGGSAGDVLLPAFSGQTVDDANGECARLRLVCTVIARQPSEQYPLDVVMGSSRRRGRTCAEGRAVSLIVSTGIHIFAMPDLRFESLRNVTLALGNVKLQLPGRRSFPTTIFRPTTSSIRIRRR